MRTHIAIACLPTLEKRRCAIISLVLATSASAVPLPAAAHPAAAESPTFLDAPCVVVADKREQAYLDIEYSVMMDDTVITPGDIPVSDAKTHQFFALTGSIYQVGIDDIYIPFTDTAGQGQVFPLWITHNDVQRAAAAVEMASGVSPAQTDLPPARVLETRADFSGNWLRITQDDARRPITSAQALLPVRWQLADVPAGVYTVTGYVFSPPYNAWAARPGVVKIIDAEHNPAAGAMSPVNEVVFAYQGRRVKGCLDVPDDTKLDAYYFVEEKPELGWLPWVQDKPVQTGDQELCFHLDRADIVGSIRMRWDLRPPDGDVTSLRSRDTFTWLPGSGECTPSDTHCCDFASSKPDKSDAGATIDAGPTVDAGKPKPAAASSGGCNIATSTATPPLLELLFLLGLLRRPRRFRKTGSR
ncbi:MAG TPA: hypothetical protein VFN67_23165 [Polyangiales bacterium]|nr:hypothetical protein [Polyangiales bacterium]